MPKRTVIGAWALWVVTCACFLLYFVSEFVWETWGTVTVPQFLVHLSLHIEGQVLSLESQIKLATCVFWLIAVGLMLFCFMRVALMEKSVKESLRQRYRLKLPIPKFLDKPLRLYTLVCLGACFCALWMFEIKSGFWAYMTQEKSPFFSDNYFKLDTKNGQSAGRNLIVIFLESIEDGYADATVYEQNLIPELVALKKEGLSFSNYHKTPGGWYTIDGICAQTTGVPLARMPVDLHKITTNFDGVLGNTPSVFDLLKNLSYKTVAFSGASRTFTQKGKFFETHGVTDFRGKEYWTDNGFDKPENRGHWGYHDAFLFDRLKDYLITHKNDRFAVFFETLDTHAPKGFVAPEDVHFKDMRDCVKRLSRFTGNFIAWAKKQPWYKNTTIVLVGDHPFPVFFGEEKLSDLTRIAPNRQIFNVILNPAVQPKREVKGWSSMDMAPTILSAMGVTFNAENPTAGQSKKRIGVGVSLFSDEQTLVEKHGADFFSNELKKKNDLYDKLY